MGFPVALMLAWAFDITADGIQVTPDGATPRTHTRRNMILLVAVGLLPSAVAGLFLLARGTVLKNDRWIFRLPFHNLDDDKKNDYCPEAAYDVLCSYASS